MVLFTLNWKLYVGFPITFRLTNSKGQGQGHAHFDSEDLGNGDRYGNNYY